MASSRSGDAIRSLRAELLQAMQRRRAERSCASPSGPVELEFQLTATIEVGAGGAVRFWVIDADAKALASDAGAPTRSKVTLTPVHASKVPGRHRGRRARDVRAAPRGRLGALREGRAMIAARVVQVFAPVRPRRAAGTTSSGVVLAPGLVLTARHARRRLRRRPRGPVARRRGGVAPVRRSRGSARATAMPRCCAPAAARRSAPTARCASGGSSASGESESFGRSAFPGRR